MCKVIKNLHRARYQLYGLLYQFYIITNNMRMYGEKMLHRSYPDAAFLSSPFISYIYNKVSFSFIGCDVSLALKTEILFLSCYQSLDDGIGEAFLLHGVQTLDGATARSGYLVDGCLWVLTCSLK